MFEDEIGQLEGLRVPQAEVGQTLRRSLGSPSPGGGHHPPGWIKGRFIRKTPYDWVVRACRLSGGKVVATAWAIWYEAGRRKRLHDLKITSKMLEGFSVDRHAKSRVLAALEAAGLIRVERRPRKNPLVTILEVEGGAEAEAE